MFFSRFYWQVPLDTKRNKCLKKELAQIYSVHGIPERLQSDKGGELKKKTSKSFVSRARSEC